MDWLKKDKDEQKAFVEGKQKVPDGKPAPAADAPARPAHTPAALTDSLDPAGATFKNRGRIPTTAPVQAIPRPGSPFPSVVMQALNDMEMGRATKGQGALLFQYNDEINAARLNGMMPDRQYQAAQNDFARLNQDFAKRAATDVGADFKVQTSTSQRFAPGTDSDYICEVKSSKPVEQIADMQKNYNTYVNEFLEQNVAPEDLRATHKNSWHVDLDVDFMADPTHVTDDQFRAIARLNNDAYVRRGAADYERLSRPSVNTEIKPEHFRDYVREMQDFIERKNKKLQKYRKNPSLLNNLDEMADWHKFMAQEQKYLSRIESANKTLRKQAGLPIEKTPFKDPFYEFKTTADGNTVCRKRSPGTIASRASFRSPGNRATTIAGRVLSEHSLQRATRQFAESLADAHVKSPGKWPNAASHIAEIAEQLPPAQKARIVESITTRNKHVFANQVASEMRKRPGPKPQAPPPGTRSPSTLGRAGMSLDDALKRALGVSDEVKDMCKLRRAFNQKAAKALGGLDKLGKVGTAVELLAAANETRRYLNLMNQALDPNITDAEADRLFEQAQEAAFGMSKAGALGALCEAVPVVGAVYGGWTIGYDGSRYLLENTETGQAIDRAVFEYFDRHTQAYEQTVDVLDEYMGRESRRMRREDELRDLEKSYLKAIAAGRIKLKDGVSTRDIIAMLRSGDIYGLDDMMESALGGPGGDDGDDDGGGDGTDPAHYSLTMVWYNDVGWIHVGSVKQFRSLRARGSEIWGGTSKEPLNKKEMLGGKTFDKADDAMEALKGEIGGAVKRHRAPLAFPKIYYMAGDKKIGFEIMKHPVFKDVKARADAGK
jgi:hypothetical protein